MDLLGTVLLLVLVGSEAQNLVNVTVEPGQDVTLTCSLNHTEIFWFMEDQNQTRVRIGPVSSPAVSGYDHQTKYLTDGNRLVIKNVSAEDSRLVSCRTKEDDEVETFSLLLPDVPGPLSTRPPVLMKVYNTQPDWVFTIKLIAGILGIPAAIAACYQCCKKKKDEDETANQQTEMENERMNPSVDCER